MAFPDYAGTRIHEVTHSTQIMLKDIPNLNSREASVYESIYIESMARKILAAYDHDRIILIRSRIPDVSVVDSSVYGR